MQIIRDLIAALDRHTEAMREHTAAMEEHAFQMDELGFELNCAEIPHSIDRVLSGLKAKPESVDTGEMPC